MQPFARVTLRLSKFMLNGCLLKKRHKKTALLPHDTDSLIYKPKTLVKLSRETYCHLSLYYSQNTKVID